MTTFIDIHVLQTVPSSNINRDDTGRPKTGIFGGFTRARVSSQAWKRATRKDFARYLPDAERGVRTRRIIADLIEQIRAIDDSIEQTEAIELAKNVMGAAGIKFKAARKKKGEEGDDQLDLSEYLLFVSNQQVQNLARLAVEGRSGAIDKTAAKKAIQLDNGIEVALFGRMVADDASINVDAAVQVAHALSTHAVESEYDYYTAVDDRNTEGDPAAGMIGVIEFNSSTLYRYATINLDQLHENLGDLELESRAAEAFIRSFVVSMPTGKQNTFANGTLPDAVVVQLRDGRPINLVGAFEEPVRPDSDRSISTLSAERLATRAQEIDECYGMAPSDSFVLAVNGSVREVLGSTGEVLGLDPLVSAVKERARAVLETIG
ncbi:type I-E CRISPR-associated protein Cas7/Cse4/CasC [Nocardioides carbamazepini]|uniref:type I-E CRISPR-associated protein Cas7/Cse4/CasC n=1 Tax=Nocardioides carbamazepini TaxID=2854259 RepID=UPI002149B59E|nr:type I-E CRISPR-associated protein Cas7/Cse4/CasC [Nocardioides carbamazepini]MCR1781133.1 type I-E CRISPR-associated protein Cas7/Cse4/CasC [Nocardioides carbamazepini]